MDLTQILAFPAVLCGALKAFLKWEGDQRSFKSKNPAYHSKESLCSSLNFCPELFVLSLRFSRKALGSKCSLGSFMGLFCL